MTSQMLPLPRNSVPSASRESEGSGDDLLLSRFVSTGDAAAFEALVRRHGPMVYGVCRRLLPSSRDTDDAFQAVFLVLVQRADSVRPRAAVGAWLHGVARKVSGKMRQNGRREEFRSDLDFHEPSTSDGPVPLESEEAAVVHEEIDRLPDLYREVVVRHYMQGQTYDAIAASLNCPKGTIATRLAEAKKRLHGRLMARGFGAVAIATLPQALAPQAVPAALMAATASQTPVPASVAATAAAVSQSMALGGLTKLAAVVVCLLGLAVLPVVVPLGLSRSPNPTSEKVELVSNKLSVRPQLDGLDKREVPAVLGGAIPGQGTWSYDQSADILTVTGNDKANLLAVNTSAEIPGMSRQSIKIGYGPAGDPYTTKAVGSIDTKVVPTGRTVIKIDGGAGNDKITFGYTDGSIASGNGNLPSNLRATVARVDIQGGTGNDYIEHKRLGYANSPIAITADGGAGDDRLDFAGAMYTAVGVIPDGSPMIGTIRLNGGDGNDQIRFDKRAASVTGGAGNDRIMMSIDRPVSLAEFRKLVPSNDYNSREDTYSGNGSKGDGFK